MAGPVNTVFGRGRRWGSRRAESTEGAEAVCILANEIGEAYDGYSQDTSPETRSRKAGTGTTRSAERTSPRFPGGRPAGTRGAVAVSSVAPNKANFRRFWARNAGGAKKQSQSKPIRAAGAVANGLRRDRPPCRPGIGPVHGAIWSKGHRFRLFGPAAGRTIEADVRNRKEGYAGEAA